MSTNVELPDQHAPVPARAQPVELHHFGALPAWLQAAAQPECVQSALARSIPAFAAGELELEACEIKRLRFRAKTRCWTGSYRLTVAGPQPGQHRVVVLHGTIIPPGLAAPAAAGAAPAFGEQGWRTYLPDLRLDLHSEQPLHDPVPPCLSGGPGPHAPLARSGRRQGLPWRHRGQNAYAAMRALWDSPLATSEMVCIRAAGATRLRLKVRHSSPE